MQRPPEAVSPTHQDLAARARRAAWRARLIGLLVVSAVSALIAGGLGANALWRRALSESCAPFARAEITIEDLIALKHRKNAYQASMQDDAYLQMSATEVNVMVQGTIDYDVLFAFEGDTVDAHVTVPTARGCYNVHYVGTIDVRDGVATFVPRSLAVGEVDVSGVVGGQTFNLDAALVRGWVDDRVVRALENSAHVEFTESVVRIQLTDRWRMW